MGKIFHAVTVHIQWGSKRTLKGGKLQKRSIQVGMNRHLIKEYNYTWITEIIYITHLTMKISQLKRSEKYKEAKKQSSSTDDAVFESIFLALRNINKKWEIQSGIGG